MYKRQAFNTSDLALVRAVVEQAEASNTPAILQFAPGEFKYATPYFFRYVTERLKASKVPFALHLDHGKSIEECAAAIQAGFTSVMFDGSLLPLAEDVYKRQVPVFASTFAMFGAGRAYEQIRNSIAYPRANVKIVCSHAGVLIGEDGASHQCIEDLSLMRTLPGMTVLAPCDSRCV